MDYFLLFFEDGNIEGNNGVAHCESVCLVECQGGEAHSESVCFVECQGAESDVMGGVLVVLVHLKVTLNHLSFSAVCRAIGKRERAAVGKVEKTQNKSPLLH